MRKEIQKRLAFWQTLFVIYMTSYLTTVNSFNSFKTFVYLFPQLSFRFPNLDKLTKKKKQKQKQNKTKENKKTKEKSGQKIIKWIISTEFCLLLTTL